MRQFAPTADVVITDGVMAGDSEILEAFIENRPLFRDPVGCGDEGVHDEVASGDGEMEVFRESVDRFDAFFPACTGLPFGLCVDIR